MQLILTSIALVAIFIVSLAIFIQTAKELWENIKEDYSDWFKTTTLGMWYNNKKNGVTILSDKEYERLLKSGKIRPIEVEE